MHTHDVLDGQTHQREFSELACWMERALEAAFGPPFHWTDYRLGVWHIPKEPISAGLAGLTVFRPLDELGEGFSSFARQLQARLSEQTIDWTWMVYEQRIHSGELCCSTAPVATVAKGEIAVYPALFVVEVKVDPKGRGYAT